MQIWHAFRSDQPLALVPWANIEIEGSDALRELGFVGGVSREVVSSLREAHVLLQSAIDAWISDVVSRRAVLEASSLQLRVEDAYAEVVQRRPHLRTHIRCGRQSNGSFQWEFPMDSTQSATIGFSGLRVTNAVTGQTVSFGCDRPIAPAVGRFLGFLDGTHTVSEIRSVIARSGPDLEGKLTHLIELLHAQHCLTIWSGCSVQARWLAETCDQDIVHLGHAGLLYRKRDNFLFFDPWLMPWYAEEPIPSLWGSLLPRPAAIFLTHEHSDHLNVRTLLHLPKHTLIIVPSRKNRRALYYDYGAALGELGFTQVIELAHGDIWPFEGGGVVSIPFFGEDPCDLELPRNCYLVTDRGRNTLVLVDSGPNNAGRSVVTEGVIDDLVRRYGPIATVFASQQQSFLVRGKARYACLSPPGRWLETGEHTYLAQKDLVELAASARARLFVAYATGGADWYPNSLSFMFSREKPARMALWAANWEPLEGLRERLRPYGCDYHFSHASDVFRAIPDGGTRVICAPAPLAPATLFGTDNSQQGRRREAAKSSRTEDRAWSSGIGSSSQKNEPSILSTRFRDDQYLSLIPWAWLEPVPSESSTPFPFLGGAAPDVLASLHEAHALLRSALDAWINDVLSRRAVLEDSMVRMRLEDAYAEVVRSQPHLREHIRCGRQPDGTFEWEFPLDSTQSAAVSYSGLRVENAVTKASVSFSFDRPIAPAVGRFLGFLDGTHTVSEIRAALDAAGSEGKGELTRLVDLLHRQQCLTGSARASMRAHWLTETRDRDIVHLGHAGLLYRQREGFLLFDPWLMPWFGEALVPSLWSPLLPSPAAIFLTHEHSDHLNVRTLLHLPKHIPIIVPSRKNRRALYYDYGAALGELGFTQVIELAHGDIWPFEGGGVVSIPFFGEDPCDLELPRNCYLVTDRGRNTLVLVDSGPNNAGRSLVTEGVIDNLVRRYGPIATVFASQQQFLDVRGYYETACLSPPGRWLETGEHTYLAQKDLVELAASARARLFVSYATGGADWYSDLRPFMFSREKPARMALWTANWEPFERLRDQLRPYRCDYHCSYALDVFRASPDGGTEIVSAPGALAPAMLFGLDNGG